MATDRLINLILLFFAYAFLGWCIEVTLKYFQFHRFINRGFLTGPWLPIYGSGAALGAGPTGILRRHDLHCVVSSVRLPGIYDKLCSGETLPCSLVGLQLKAHEPAW